MVITDASTDLAAGDSCSPHCKYLETKIECLGCIPQRIPNGIEEVALVKLDPDTLGVGFCDVTWPSVTSLSITTREDKYFNLDNGAFDCLGYLDSFRLSSPVLRSFDNGTFSGLTNLTIFDLSGCTSISLDRLYETLSLSNNFPFLTHIVLSSIANRAYLVIDQMFINSLSTRPISYIDLSHSNVDVSFTLADKLCSSLHTLILSDGIGSFHPSFWKCGKCNSLRVFDGSGNSNTFKFVRSCVNKTLTIRLVAFLRAVRVLFTNRLISSPQKSVDILNCTLKLKYVDSLEEYHVAENYIPAFEFKLVHSRIAFLNLSHNRIENINPHALRHLPSLTRLDLSHNNLSKAKAFKNIFSSLFKYSTQLREIDLSANNLEISPNDTFVSNIFLELLNLSYNSFDQINFHFWNLPNLTTIDLSFNWIESFDSHSRRYLDDWYRFHLENNASVNILLDGNPFSCGCSALDFVEWFVASPISTLSEHEYHCLVDAQKISMTDAAINAAQDDCDRIERRWLQVMLGSTLTPTCLLIASVVAIILCRRYRRKQRVKLQDDRIRLLRENDARFAVFLSYPSDENDFVTRNILEPLQVRVSTFKVSHFSYW